MRQMCAPPAAHLIAYRRHLHASSLHVVRRGRARLRAPSTQCECSVLRGVRGVCVLVRVLVLFAFDCSNTRQFGTSRESRGSGVEWSGVDVWKCSGEERTYAYAHVELGECVGALLAVLLVDALPVHLPHQVQHVALRLVVQLHQLLVILRAHPQSVQYEYDNQYQYE